MAKNVGQRTTMRVLETPLKGEHEGKALYLATHINSPRKSMAASSRLRKLPSTAPTPVKIFDPEEDFNYESKAETPESIDDNKAALKQTYCRMCQILKVVPCSAFVKQIGRDVLDLRELKLDRKEFKAILTSLLSDTELVMVDLSGNPITHKEVDYIGELMNSNKFITHLTLSEMQLSGKAMETLSKVLKTCIGITCLDLSSNFLCDRDCDSICNLIEETDGIRDLILHHNELGECGVQMGRSIAENITITSLDLSWNHIRGQGAVGLCRGLQRNQHIAKINLAWNGFGFEGCVGMASVFMNNTSLQIVDLTSNRIHLPALHKLMDGLCKNKTVTTLHLGLNPIPAHCTTYILDRLKKWKHSNLKELDLKGVVVDKHFQPVLDEIQKERIFIVRYDTSLPLNKIESSKIDPKNIFNIDPIRILFFMKQHLRTIDLFLKIDKDISGSLSKEEMRYAFELEGYPISDMALDQVMGYLDTNNDGDVDLQEFFDGERRAKREMIKEAQEKARKSQNSTTPSDMNTPRQADYSQAFLKPNEVKKSTASSPRPKTRT